MRKFIVPQPADPQSRILYMPCPIPGLTLALLQTVFPKAASITQESWEKNARQVCVIFPDADSATEAIKEAGKSGGKSIMGVPLRCFPVQGSETNVRIFFPRREVLPRFVVAQLLRCGVVKAFLSQRGFRLVFNADQSAQRAERAGGVFLCKKRYLVHDSWPSEEDSDSNSSDNGSDNESSDGEKGNEESGEDSDGDEDGSDNE